MAPDVRIPDGETKPSELAELAELRYVRDSEAGIVRERTEEGFEFRYPDGRPVRSKKHLERIEQLVIPPAWQEVWICRDARGHLQATGRDTKGRKQYIYHERWAEISNLAKFSRMHAFGRVLPGLRAHVHDTLEEDGSSLRRTCAVLVALLDRTYARIGNEEYVRANRSFGLSTLRRKHVRIENGRARLSFTAKGGMERFLTVEDPLLVRVLEVAMERPGRRLFRYACENGGGWRDLESDQVNDFIREATGQPFTAKDFRTWKASAMVAGDLFRRRDACRDEDAATRAEIVRDAIDRAAEALGNTRAVCRTYYTHPVLIESFEDGTFIEAVDGFRPSARKWLDRDEQVLLRVLRHFERTTGGGT